MGGKIGCLDMEGNLVKYLLVLMASSALLGCASGVQKLRKIDPGMSLQQVESIMGRRDSFSTAEKDGSTYILYQYMGCCITICG